jgi:hypothetical protein
MTGEFIKKAHRAALGLMSGIAALACCGMFPFQALAEEAGRNVDGIMDNSFLVEEAYNQEKGVIQHIATLHYGLNRRHGGDEEFWNLTFTQEWPLFNQTHQLSYTIPYAWLEEPGRSENGFGDVLLNYRLQAYFNQENLMAFAPRVSLVLPTGDSDRGLGEDTLGLQFNLPFSLAVSDDWFVHLNAGMTYLPGAASAQDRDLAHFNLGASVIYAATRDLHFLLEWVGNWNELKEPGFSRDREFVALLSPGVRKAFNFGGATQLVAGLALPIGVSHKAPEIGGFFYLSFEHSILKEQ